jgi:hypothetical protein
MSESGALLCGFWGKNGVPTGLAWRLGNEEGAIAGRSLASGSVVVSVGGRLSEESDVVSISFDESDAPAEATLSRGAGEVALDSPSGGPAAGTPKAALCQASVRTEGNGKPRRSRGFIVRWDDDPAAGAGIFRAVALPAPNDEFVLVTARREPGAANHAEEATTAWLLRADGTATAFDEALLSTQYDGDGLQTRVGLELWPAEGTSPPLRGAGTTFGLSRAGGTNAALLSSSVEGSEGVGAYLIRRA